MKFEKYESLGERIGSPSPNRRIKVVRGERKWSKGVMKMLVLASVISDVGLLL